MDSLEYINASPEERMRMKMERDADVDRSLARMKHDEWHRIARSNDDRSMKGWFIAFVAFAVFVAMLAFIT